MFEDQQLQSRRGTGAGPVPPPPIDPDELRAKRSQTPQGAPVMGQPPAPRPPQAPIGGTAQEKDWGPWKPKQNPEYNPPDTPQEIQQVLTQYSNGGAPTPPPPGQKAEMPMQSGGRGKTFMVVGIVIVSIILVGGLVFAYFQFFRSSTSTNTENQNENSNQNVNSTVILNVHSDVQTNENTNTISANSNSEGNVNGVVNLNAANVNSANVNSASNTNSNVNVSTNVHTNTSDDDTTSAKDTDNDGLTDTLELIYGTDINNPDTDGDGYLDGQEIQNGFNPKGPGKLPSSS